LDNERLVLARPTVDSPDAEAVPLWRWYVVALACVLAAFGIRYWLTPIVGDEMPFMGFIAAALVAAW